MTPEAKTPPTCGLCHKDRADCAHVECPRRVHWQATRYKPGSQGLPLLHEERHLKN